MSSSHVKRIVFVGDVAVGKSMFIRSLIGDARWEFPTESYHPTEGTQCYPLIVDPRQKVQGTSNQVRFYEIGGQHGLSNQDLDFVGRLANVVVAMFDLSRPRTFYRAANWVTLLRQRYPKVQIVLVGNKRDQELTSNNQALVWNPSKQTKGDDRSIIPLLCRTIRTANVPYYLTDQDDDESLLTVYRQAYASC